MIDSLPLQNGNYIRQPLEINIHVSKTQRRKVRNGNKTVKFKRLVFLIDGISYKSINGNLPDKKINKHIKDLSK